MPFSEDLLEQAQHLAIRDKRRPKQASLRRAVSTAYYALFHFLIAEAISNWKNNSQRAALARAFEHRNMKTASAKAANARAATSNPTVLVELQRVANTFTLLQQDRNTADYDNSVQWTRIEVQADIDRVRAAFASWRAIRTEPLAQDYLLSLLVKDR